MAETGRSLIGRAGENRNIPSRPMGHAVGFSQPVVDQEGNARMGSTGSERFSDYPSQSGSSGGPDAGSAGDADSAGSDPCQEPVEAVNLEEVARCAYFSTHGAIPPPGTEVEVVGLHQGRIAVAERSSGLIMGYLPTSYSYLASCLESTHYAGDVVASSATPVPTVTVSFSPT